MSKRNFHKNHVELDMDECYASKLPLEVVIYFMNFLNYSDRVAASQVCILWYEASLHPKFRSQEKVVVRRSATEAISVFTNSLRPYVHFTFLEIEITNKMVDFWSKVAPELKTLCFANCDVYEKVLIDVLSRCFNLEWLMVHDCRELFMPGRLLDDPQDRALLSKSLNKLKVLNLSSNRYLSDALLNRVLSVMPNLNAISLEDCQISYHAGLYKKYYPNGLTSQNPDFASETVLTFQNIYNVLYQRGKHITNINLSRTLVDSAALAMIAEIKDLNLEELHVKACKQLTNSAVLAFSEHQKCLTLLDLSSCVRITDPALQHICSNLTNLRKLSVRNCRAITDLGIVQLKSLKNLEELDISQLENVTGEAVQEALCSKRNTTLKKLIMEGLGLITNTTVISIAENLENLSHLNLSYCFSAVTDSSLQAIFQHLLQLRTLKLASCDAITDAGLTGMGMGATVDNVELDKEIKHLVQSTPRLHISVGSKAEVEIIQDALRKKAVQKMCETQLIESASVGYSLARLKGLQELDLRCCNKITDVSLKYAFHFLELQHLNLSRCQQITHEGLRCLGENNPSIDTLSLSQCYNLTDEGIVAVTSTLHRLKYLEIKGCNQLTDISVDAIVCNCRQLRYLDASLCNNMSDRIAAVLRKLPVNTFYSKSEQGGTPPFLPPPMVH